MEVEIHASLEKLARDMKLTLDREELRSKVQRVALEVGIDGKVGKTLIVGCGMSSVELRGGIGGNCIVYHFDPASAQENEIRHELMHISDELNPAFMYDMAYDTLAIEVVRKVTDRETPLSRLLCELWNVNLDARLKGRGIPRDRRFAYFQYFMKIDYGLPIKVSKEIFEKLWTDRLIPYPELVQIADEVWAEALRSQR